MQMSALETLLARLGSLLALLVSVRLRRQASIESVGRDLRLVMARS